MLAVPGVLIVTRPNGLRVISSMFFREITGYQCPGCGALRALHQMFNGHILAAASYNSLVFAALPFFSWILLSGAISSERTMHLANIFSSRKTIGWAILSLVIFGIIGNTDIYPLKLLAS